MSIRSIINTISLLLGSFFYGEFAFSQEILQTTDSLAQHWPLKAKADSILALKDELKTPLLPAERSKLIDNYQALLASFRFSLQNLLNVYASQKDASTIGKALVYSYFNIDNDAEENKNYVAWLRTQNLDQDATISYYEDEINGRFEHIVGNVLPEFLVTDVLGKLVTLHIDKPTLIVFWASWCAPCRAENPRLKSIYQQYSSKPFEIVGISVDDNNAFWKRALRQDALPWSNYILADSWNHKLARYFAIHQIPQNVLVSSKGKILARNIGLSQLEKMLSSNSIEN